MISVYIIDDHQILIDAIVNHLATIEDIDVVGSNVSPVAAISEIQSIQPDVVITDISMPEMNGIDCAKQILENNPNQRIIMLSTHLEVSIVKKVMKIGVLGYVSKSTGITTIDTAIRSVHAREKFLDDNISKIYMDDLMNAGGPAKTDLLVIPKLTKREDEVLRLIANEGTTQEIGNQLHISANTVETHRRNLINKFQVRNSVGLIRKAMELRLLD